MEHETCVFARWTRVILKRWFVPSPRTIYRGNKITGAVVTQSMRVLRSAVENFVANGFQFSNRRLNLNKKEKEKERANFKIDFRYREFFCTSYVSIFEEMTSDTRLLLSDQTIADSSEYREYL